MYQNMSTYLDDSSEEKVVENKVIENKVVDDKVVENKAVENKAIEEAVTKDSTNTCIKVELLGSCQKLGVGIFENENKNITNFEDCNEEKTKNVLIKKTNEVKYERIDKLIYINNIIESMSNAKTIKNDNSSRCGRINDLIFEEKKKNDDTNMFNFCFSNIKIMILLLEINRCIAHNEGERNFHIFYQLIWGLSDEQLKERKLIRDINYYNLLNNGACNKKSVKIIVKKVEDNSVLDKERQKDNENFKYLLKGLRYINYDEKKINEFLDVITGLIHLGEIVFDENENLSSSDLKSREENEYNKKTYENICSCLKIDMENLYNTIKYKNIRVLFEKIRTERNQGNSLSTVHTLIKVIYKKLFNKIIYDINMTHLNEKEKEVVMNEKIYELNHNVISILDLYGFEELSCNDFEQLSINLANEKLNNYYINNEIEKEKNIYKMENIFWNDITIPNYQDTICFIEKMYTNLDDITKLNNIGQKKVDDHFFNYLLYNENDYLKTNIYGFISNKDNIYTSKKQNIKKNTFFIKHYAGCVTYTINNWIHKNSDKIDVEIEELIATSRNFFLGNIIEENEISQVVNVGNNKEFQIREQVQGQMLLEHVQKKIDEKDNLLIMYDDKNKTTLETSLNNNKEDNKEGNTEGNTYSTTSLCNNTYNGTQNKLDASFSGNYNRSSSNNYNKNNILSVSKKYIKELYNLFNNLEKTDMYYVRCILPNEYMRKDKFKKGLVYCQLKQCGANEVIKIMNNGLSHKIEKDELLSKLKNFIPKELQYCFNYDITYYLMRLFDYKGTCFEIGKSYVFMKSHIYTQINYYFYNKFIVLNDRNNLCSEENRKQILKDITIRRFKRCVSVIKINNWINKYYLLYLEKKKEMKKKACDYIYKMYLIYKTMKAIKKTFFYNVNKLNKICVKRAYHFAFVKIKKTKKNHLNLLTNNKGKIQFQLKGIKKIEMKTSIDITKKVVSEGQNEKTQKEITNISNCNNLNKNMGNNFLRMTPLEDDNKKAKITTSEEIFVCTPDNYHYVYNNIDWIIIYKNNRISFYNIFYNYERVNKKYILNYNNIVIKQVDRDEESKHIDIKIKEHNNYAIKHEPINTDEKNTSVNIETVKDVNSIFDKEKKGNTNLKIEHNKNKQTSCFLSNKFFFCITQHPLYKNLFIGIDKNLNLILFTYPNMRTIKSILKIKIKSIKQNNKNLPNTLLPRLYKSKRYESTFLQRKSKHDVYDGLNVTTHIGNNIIKNENLDLFLDKDNINDVFSNENINMFIHVYKNIYVLSTIENILNEQEEGIKSVVGKTDVTSTNEVVKENGKNELETGVSIKIKNEIKKDEVTKSCVYKQIHTFNTFEAVDNNKKEKPYGEEKPCGEENSCGEEKPCGEQKSWGEEESSKKGKSTETNKKSKYYSFLKSIKKENYIIKEFYNNLSFKVLKINFLPSNMSHIVYLCYTLINNDHYLLLTIVNLFSNPIYKHTIYIPINNIINNEKFVDFVANRGNSGSSDNSGSS
uniref:Myosin motor domain-containing protein n=1 Tax=Piliocolobus tephrosceles TaxID=591936 RepID=A0A8C9GRL0_9PRIM